MPPWHQDHTRYDAFNRRIAFYEDPDGPLGPEPETFTFVLHDLAQPPTAEQVSQGGLAPYVDGIYASAAFAANPVADFVDRDTSDGITPTLTDRRLYGAGVDSLLAREDTAGVVDFALRDFIGSVRAWVEADGTIAARYDFDSYGIPSNPADLSGGTRFGFTGRGASYLSGWWYHRARWLVSAVGRFASLDPAGPAAGVNAYGYVSNQPTVFLDTTGLHPTGMESESGSSGGYSLPDEACSCEAEAVSALGHRLDVADIAVGAAAAMHGLLRGGNKRGPGGADSPWAAFWGSLGKSCRSIAKTYEAIFWYLYGEEEKARVMMAEAYELGPLGQAEGGYRTGVKISLGVATAATTAACAVGAVEFFCLRNGSIVIESALAGGRTGGIVQIRPAIPGEKVPPWFRIDLHRLSSLEKNLPRWCRGRRLPHIDIPPLRIKHWPWEQLFGKRGLLR